MLSTDELPKHYRKFARGSQTYIDSLKKDFDFLYNYVDVRNTLAVRWLSWLGFELDAPEPFGIDQLPFHKFHMEIK